MTLTRMFLCHGERFQDKYTLQLRLKPRHVEIVPFSHQVSFVFMSKNSCMGCKSISRQTNLSEEYSASISDNCNLLFLITVLVYVDQY